MIAEPLLFPLECGGELPKTTRSSPARLWRDGSFLPLLSGDCHGLAHLGSDPKSGRGTPPFPRRTPIRSRPCTLPKLPSSPLYPSAGTRSARVRSPGPSASARIAARRSQCQSLSKAVRHLKPGRPMRLSHPHVGRNYTTPEIGNLQFDKHPPAGCLLQCMNVRTLD